MDNITHTFCFTYYNPDMDRDTSFTYEYVNSDTFVKYNSNIYAYKNSNRDKLTGAN